MNDKTKDTQNLIRKVDALDELFNEVDVEIYEDTEDWR